ncbi:regucalcin-like [Pectinophora gossypiella]|uniref:regucalcin-like n=1 Tax=Pectinophora gossypiella TaxID=13191 RepID=UPI00214EBE33|nr:regucalcin-like [Pectinophora gossypiella]
MNFLFKIIALLALAWSNNASHRASMPLIRNVHRGGDHFEGPHWSVAENALYWVDIVLQRVLRLDGASGNVTTREIGFGPVSLVVTVKDNPKLVLITSRAGVFFLPWDASPGDSAMRQLTVVDLGHPDNRGNDGKVDAKGRLWFGTMGSEVNGEVDTDQATLYLLDQYNYVHPEAKVRPVSVSNGIAWTSDNKYMFYIDTPTRNVDVFDFELATGSIRNRRTLFSFQANNVTGLPDGMTIDTDGNLWIACYDGGKVIKVDSRSGKLLESHKMPATKVTSVMWGGRDLSTLYVTTSRRGLSAAELAEQPEAGSLFAIEGTGSKGYPENLFIFPDAATY